MVDHEVHGALTTTKLFNVNNVCNGILCHSNSFHATVSQVMDSDVEIHPVCISLCWRSKLKLVFYAQRYIQIKKIKSNQVFKLDNAKSGCPFPEPEAHVRAFPVEMEFLEMLVSEERGKPEYPGENLSEQRKNQNDKPSPHVVRAQNPWEVSALRRPCSLH